MKIRRMKSKNHLRTMLVMLWCQSVTAVLAMGIGQTWLALVCVFLMSISFSHLIGWAGKIIDMPAESTRTDHNIAPAQSDRLHVSPKAIERKIR